MTGSHASVAWFALLNPAKIHKTKKPSGELLVWTICGIFALTTLSGPYAALWAVLRLPMEMGILGWKFTVGRLASAFIFPPIAGLIAQTFFSDFK